MSTLRLVGILGIVGLFAGCAQTPPERLTSSAIGTVATTRTSSVSESPSDNIPTQSEVIAFQPIPSAPQTGHASWYAHKFQGRRTANGERYDGKALTAAHRTLPFGTYVRVTSLSTSKSVVVRINDRGPFVKGRIIDLSYAAAKEIGLTRTGLTNVQIERVTKTADTQTAPNGSES